MKKTFVISISCLLATLPFAGFAQQKSSGVVDYQVTMQRNNTRMGGANAPGSDNGNDSGGPAVFTMNRSFTFNADGGKLSSPEFTGRRRNSGRHHAQGDRGGRNFRGRSSNSEYVDFTGKKYIRAFKRGDNDTTFYMDQDFRPAENFQTSDKTKKIAGYTCHEATAQLRNSAYTIWYTTDIPVTYSPVNGLVPPNGGFVLGLRNERMEYKATKVQLQDVADSAVKIQGPSHELTKSDIQNMRRQMMERRRNRGGRDQ